MARTFMTARKSMPASRPIAPKKMKAIAKRFRNSHITNKRPSKSFKKTVSSALGPSYLHQINTMTKSSKPNKSRKTRNIGKDSDQKSDQKNQSDQKSKIPRLNECCKFCNNRLIIEAVKTNNNHLLKQLLNNYDSITNPFQGWSSNVSDQNAFKLAIQNKNKEAVLLLLKELDKKQKRPNLEKTILQSAERGNQGFHNFNIRIAQIQQARGSKEGNDAFIRDSLLRNNSDDRKIRIFRKELASIDIIKLYFEGEKKSDGRNFFGVVQNNITEYVRQGKVAEGCYLLQYDFDNNMSDLNRLYAATLSGNLPQPIVRISITKQSKIHNMLSPLHCACISPNLNIIKSLHKLMPIFSLPDKNRRNLIHYAAANANADIIKYLLANGSDPNEFDSMRRTPLMIACQLGKIEVLQALLDHFDKKKKAKEDNQKQKKGGKKKPAKKKGKKDKNEDEAEEEENDDGDDDAIDINYIEMKDRSGQTALNYAVYNGHSKIVAALLDHGADIESKNSKSNTLIMVAAQRGHFEIVKELVKRGADVHGKVHKQKKNPLIAACENGHLEIVEFLCPKLIEANCKDTSGNTPLHYASGYGWSKIVQYLIQQGAELTTKNLWNTSPASLAMQKGHFLILDIFLSNFKGNSDDLVQDSQGRDLVCQNLLKIDMSTYDHLISISKRIKIQPLQVDQLGLNPFHYLAGFDIETAVQELALKITEENEEDSEKELDQDNEEENEEEEEEGEGENDDDKIEEEQEEDQNSNSQENEDESMSEQEEEEEVEQIDTSSKNKSKKKEDDSDISDEDSDQEQNKELKIQKKAYKQISEQILKIADLLQKWGYAYNERAITEDGHIPLTLAVQQGNIPMTNWFLDKKIKIDGLVHKLNKRNILHSIFHLIIRNFDKKFDYKDLLQKFQKSYQKEIKQMLLQVDIRGFTPLLLGLSRALYDSKNNKNQNKLLAEKIETLLEFCIKNGHQFQEEVPSERPYNTTSNGIPEEEEDEINSETNNNSSRKRWRNVHSRKRFPQRARPAKRAFRKQIIMILFKLGLIDFQLKDKPNEDVQVNYNWLHYIARILNNFESNQKTLKLIKFIQNSLGKEMKDSRKFILSPNIYMETPLTLSIENNQILQIFLAQLNPTQLIDPITGLYLDGQVLPLHFLALIKNKEFLQNILTKLKDKEVISQDGNGNNILHYAAYYRNTDLVELVLNKFNINTSQANQLGNTPLHVGVQAPIANYELPKLEELLLQKNKALLNLKNNDSFTPLHLCAIHYREENTDPISLVNLMLSFDSNIATKVDRFGSTPLHIFATCNAPLSLLSVLRESGGSNKTNLFQNTPLHEALLQGQNNNALLLLQNDNNVPKYAYSYIGKTKIDQYRQLNGVLHKEYANQDKWEINDFQPVQENVYKLALKHNFFGIYHLTNQNNKGESQLSMLEGSVLSQNLKLFNQLLANYSQQDLKKVTKEEGRNLLHILALSFDSKNDEKEGENQSENDFEEDNEDEDEQMSGDEANEKDDFQKVYQYLTQDLKLRLDSLDKDSMTPLHLAIQSQNQQFLDQAFSELKKIKNQKEVVQILNIKELKSQASVVAYLFKQNNLKRVYHYVKLIINMIGKGFKDIDLSYKIDTSKQDCSTQLYRRDLKLELIKDTKKASKFNSLFDLVFRKEYNTIKHLIRNGVSFEIENENKITPLMIAVLKKDFHIIKLLVENGKVKIDKKDFKGQTALNYALNYPGITYSTKIATYLASQCPQLKAISQQNIKKIHEIYLKSKPLSGSLKEYEQNCKSIEKNFQEYVAEQRKIQKQNPSYEKVQVVESLVDQVSGMESTHDVLKDNNSVELSVLMHKVDVSKGFHGTFRFYLVQLLRQKINGDIILWTRWGRMQEEGQYQRTPFGSNIQAALKEFNKIFKQKSGLTFDDRWSQSIDKKYKIMAVGKENIDKRFQNRYEDIRRSISLPKLIRTLNEQLNSLKNSQDFPIFQLIKTSITNIIKEKFDLTGSNDNDRLMNSAITTDSIEQAYALLQEAREWNKKLKQLQKENKIDEVNVLYPKILDIANKYYCLLPERNFRYGNGNTMSESYNIDREESFLKEMIDFSSTLKLSIASLNNPQKSLQYCRDMLPHKMKTLSFQQDQNEYLMIMNYINQSMLAYKDSRENDFFVDNIMKITQEEIYSKMDNLIFGNLHNHWLLWHGTSNENVMGILLKGLKIKPPNANQHGSLFGNGIYFSDMFTKSKDYASINQDTFYLLLCEVALGNIANYADNWDVQRPPLGYHTVRIMGEQGPDFHESIYNDDGIVVPQGHVLKYPKPKFEGMQGKVYHQAQTFAQYLKQIEESEKQKKPNKKPANSKNKKPIRKNNQDSDESEEDEEVDQIDLDEVAEDDLEPSDVEKIEKAFLDIEDRNFEVEPNVINASYCKKRLIREREELKNNFDSIYRAYSEYVVYNQSQVRIRYIVQFTKKNFD